MSPQSRRRTLPLATALLALALTTPAMPAIAAGTARAESPPRNFPSAVPTHPGALTQSADIHAPLARAAAKAQQQQRDLRRLNTGGSYTPGSTPAVSGQAVNAPSATDVDSASQRPLPGPPTWPVNPQPIKSAPVVHASDTGGGLDWTTIGLGIAGSLLLVGGVAAVARHNRRIQRTRVTA